MPPFMGLTSWAAFADGKKAVLPAQKAVRAAAHEPARTFGKPLAAANSITPGPLETMLEAKAQVKGGMAKFTFGRSAKMPCGGDAGKEMGVNSWAAFAGTDADAVVDGDFCVLPSELQGALRSVRKSGINVVAIHQHMTLEKPRYIFFPYWGRGTALHLAQALHGAMKTTATK